MATKKSANTKKATSKTTLIKIAEAVGTIAGEISVKKDRLANMASGAIDSVKATIQDIGKKATNEKSKNVVSKIKAKSAATKKAVSKAATPTSKKASTKKAAPVAKSKTVAKKASPAKKAATKKASTVNKTAPKKPSKPSAKKAAQK